ncbi:MAG: hypothetical protein LBL24_04490 [Bacteroidales bacterium]|nr:hypothetical protein [Bacteroidales bacterium]
MQSCPKYSVNGIHAGGVTDVANSLPGLKKPVFEERYTGLNCRTTGRCVAPT